MNRSFFIPRRRTTTLLASLLLACLNTLAQPPNVKSNLSELSVERGTLILVGYSGTDFVLASDSRLSNRMGQFKDGDQKIFQVSKFTACSLNNLSRIEDIEAVWMGKSKSPVLVDFGQVIIQWAKDNPNAQESFAYTALTDIFKSRLRDIFSRNSKLGPVKVSLVCLGFEFGAPMISSADIADSSKNPGF